MDQLSLWRLQGHDHLHGFQFLGARGGQGRGKEIPEMNKIPKMM